MQTIHITLAMAVTMLDSIVERFGADHEARSDDGGIGCVYAVIEGNRVIPVCIVGQMVSDLGYLGVLRQSAWGNESEIFAGTCETSASFWDRLAEVNVTATDDAKAFFRDAQAEQDSGRAWGVAVRTAKAQMKREIENRIEEDLNRLRSQMRADAQVFALEVSSDFTISPMHDDEDPFV